MVEVLDVIVDVSGHRNRPVARDGALRRCERAGDQWARRLVASVPAREGFFESARVNELVIDVHREIDRLSRAARHGPRVRAALWPMVMVLRESGVAPPYRIVDHGCGTGYLLRWLAAHGTPPDVELVGVDLNPILVAEATRLAADAGLACRFEVGDALEPDHDAALIVSTALLHHLDAEELRGYFAAQAQGSATGFLHIDLRPTHLTVLGIALVHYLLMRVAVSRHDGIRSAQRAHPTSTLVAAARSAAGDFSVASGGLHPLDPLGPMLSVLTGLRPQPSR